MSAKRRLGPARREEDVSGSLNLAEQFECRRHEPVRVNLSQRVIQVLERFDNPWLAAPIVHGAKPREGFLTDRWIGGQRRHDECKSRLAIRVLRPFELQPEN